MLNSIRVQNYRNLKNLSIGKLGQVNLIIGRNNTGKTSLLEALSIFLHKGSTAWIMQLLNGRGEDTNRSDQTVLDNLNSLSSLFWGRRPGFSIADKISIESLFDGSNTVFGSKTSNLVKESFSIRLVKYVKDIIVDEDSRTSRVRILEEDFYDDTAETAMELHYGNTSQIISLENGRLFRSGVMNRIQLDKLQENIQFIKTGNILREANGLLWDRVSLTDKEQLVESALKIIESRIERLSFKGEARARNEDRIPVVKLKDDDMIIPLRSMGDGVNRILTIILAMVNCEKGYLLIDEFENGLHYSVQEQLWEIIFQLSQKLDIQVFATTHSNDTIRAFENIVNQNETKPLDGLLIKLENVEDNIEAVVFEPNELKIITDNLIEVRR